MVWWILMAWVSCCRQVQAPAPQRSSCSCSCGLPSFSWPSAAPLIPLGGRRLCSLCRGSSSWAFFCFGYDPPNRTDEWIQHHPHGAEYCVPKTGQPSLALAVVLPFVMDVGGQHCADKEVYGDVCDYFITHGVAFVSQSQNGQRPKECPHLTRRDELRGACSVGQRDPVRP